MIFTGYSSLFTGKYSNLLAILSYLLVLFEMLQLYFDACLQNRPKQCCDATKLHCTKLAHQRPTIGVYSGPQNPIGRHMSDFQASSYITFTKHQFYGNINQQENNLSSLDKRAYVNYVKLSVDKKGYVTCPFRPFSGM